MIYEKKKKTKNILLYLTSPVAYSWKLFQKFISDSETSQPSVCINEPVKQLMSFCLFGNRFRMGWGWWRDYDKQFLLTFWFGGSTCVSTRSRGERTSLVLGGCWRAVRRSRKVRLKQDSGVMITCKWETKLWKETWSQAGSACIYTLQVNWHCW